MQYCAIGITTFIIFHLRVVSAEKFHNPPQHQGKKKTNSSRYEPAYIAVVITGLKPFLLTTVLVLFATAAGARIVAAHLGPGANGCPLGGVGALAASGEANINATSAKRVLRLQVI